LEDATLTASRPAVNRCGAGCFPGSAPPAGEGSVVGSPPDVREADSYEGDQFGGTGNGMSIERLREEAKGEGE